MNYYKNFYQIKSNEDILEKITKERESVGYYKLPFLDTTNIKEYAKSVTQKDIVVIGIGGSSLGTFAIHQFLRNSENDKKLHFLESTDPIDLQMKTDKINLDDALFIIISKSGTTIETIAITKYVSSLTKLTSSNTICITEIDSKLSNFANSYNMKVFEIPKNVGGRFSVFSPVGLVPLAIMGLDIDKLLESCREVYQSFFNKGEYYQIILEKARFIVENKYRYNINVVFSYSSLLDGFNKWYIQLWGESLGKLNINKTRQSFTPIGVIGPVDQHSFLQLIMEGKRDKTVTFIKIKEFENNLKIPNITLNHLEELDYINDTNFQKLINLQADATIEAVKKQKDIPFDVLTIEKQDEKSIAKLMYIYELLTSVVGSFVQIDTYNQPGVEEGKIVLKKSLKSKESF